MLARSTDFLFLHGWTGSGPQHWQRWLAAALTEGGATVRFPELPDDERPVLERWLAALDRELGAAPADEACVICHSVGCWLWLHHAARRTTTRVDRALLIAPPGPEWRIPELAGFPAPPLDGAGVADAARATRLVFSRDDPYCAGGADRAFADLELDADHVPSGQHLNTAAGYGPWPALLAWCRDERVRISGGQKPALEA